MWVQLYLIYRHKWLVCDINCMFLFLSAADEYWSSYSTPTSSTPAGKKRTRKIPKSAEKVLDAPNLINDFCEC